MSREARSAFGGKKIIVLVFSFLIVAQQAFAANDLGTLQEYATVGKVISVGLNPSSTGNWYLVTNSNPLVANASLNGTSLTITGLRAGTDAVSVCTEPAGLHCLVVIATVTGNVLGANTTRFTHPVGSWLIHAGTVFYVHGTGLIPISEWNIFVSNGGQSSNLQETNQDDLNLPLLSLMTLNDSRVR